MNITLISLVFPPEPGAANRSGDLALELTHLGHKVTVVTGFPSYPTGVVQEGYTKSCLQRETWKDGIELIRVWLHTHPDRDSGKHRILHYLSFTATSLYGALFGPKPDIIYISSPPYFIGVTGWLLSRLTGAHMVLDVQDFWPEAPILRGDIKNPLLIKFLLASERFVYSRCSLIFGLSDVMVRRIVERGVDPRKVKRVFNWVDLAGQPADRNPELRHELGLEGKTVFLFAGNIGYAQGLMTVIEGADLLRDEDDIRFVFLGGGVEKQKLMDSVRERDLHNVIFLDPVPPEEVNDYYAMADLLLLHLEPLKHRQAAIPGKLQGYMASGKPVLAGAEGATADVVHQADCGWSFEPDNPDALRAAALQVLNSSREERERRGRAGRIFAEREFEIRQQVRKIAAWLERLPGGE